MKILYKLLVVVLLRRMESMNRNRPGVPDRLARNGGTRGAFRHTRGRAWSPGMGAARTGQSGERTRPACSFPRLAENIGRTEIVQAFLSVSRATAERGARSATPGTAVLPGGEIAASAQAMRRH